MSRRLYFFLLAVSLVFGWFIADVWRDNWVSALFFTGAFIAGIVAMVKADQLVRDLKAARRKLDEGA